MALFIYYSNTQGRRAPPKSQPHPTPVQPNPNRTTPLHSPISQSQPHPISSSPTRKDEHMGKPLCPLIRGVQTCIVWWLPKYAQIPNLGLPITRPNLTQLWIPLLGNSFHAGVRDFTRCSMLSAWFWMALHLMSEYLYFMINSSNKSICDQFIPLACSVPETACGIGWRPSIRFVPQKITIASSRLTNGH